MIPLSKGLGSSAACIAGGIFAANMFEGGILSRNEIIMLSADLEGHGDNVCSAITGGFSLFSKEGITKMPSGNDIGFILYIPKATLSTEESRGILPSSYGPAVIKKALELESSMLRALIDMDYEKAGGLMKLDVIHQPYRKKLIPYWDDVMSAAEAAGVWGTGLSGAGPTMISMCSFKSIGKIVEKMKFRVDKGYNLSIIGCGVNTRGTRGL
jgi:homoserine kinase